MTEQKPELGDEEVAISPKEMALFVARAVRENIAFCLFVIVLVGALGVTIVSALPQLYDATCKIFVQDGGTVTSSLASGRERNRPIEGARGLEEFILAHDNLLSIVREAKLVDRWPTTRPWPMRLKDRATEYLFGPPDRGFMERSFVEMLALAIEAAKDGESVRIHAQWRDGQSAYEVARLVQRNFLAARASHDLGPIQRAIPFLEQQVQDADQEIETAVTRFQRAKAGGGDSDSGAVASNASPPVAVGGVPVGELAGLSKRLSEVRRQQRALTEPRRRKVAELKMELIDMSASYSADHPLVRQKEARIAILSEVPAELSELRDEEAKILSTLASSSRSGTKEILPGRPRVADDPDLAASQARLASALRKSDEAMSKLENARIELATAEADFKHRYVVIEEPEVPSAPLKPKKQLMLFVLVVVASFLAGILAAAAREFRKGRLVESWQVRQLGLQLLGEVELK